MSPIQSVAGGISAQELRSFVEKIERLEEEKSQTATAIRETYADIKSHGFDPKTIRQIIRIRKMDKADAAEQEELLDLYRHALGMLSGGTVEELQTPTANAA